jgi:hypothetical protein
VLAAAGLALVASGVSVHQHAFDPTNLTAGTFAVIGGFILVGLAFVVRALLRVERALAARPMPRPSRPGETAGASAAGDTARIPFPPKAKTATQIPPMPAGPVLPELPVGETVSRDTSPSMERLENPPMVEESDVSLLPKVPSRAEDEVSDVPFGVATGRLNGAGHTKTAPRVVNGRPVRRAQQPKNSIFDSLWPKAQRPAPAVQSAPALQPAPAPIPEMVEPAAPAQTEAPRQEVPASVTILKSGVVEGMAYTLYSDGSIEAQLPQGTLRFGSITELRNHIEQNG